MISTRKRVPALFRWSAKDGLGANGKLVARSYSSEIEGVFTRASQKQVLDRNSRYFTVPHSAPPLGYVRTSAGVLTPALVLEPASSNVALRSRDFTHAAWDDNSASHTVTAGAIRGPDGLMSGHEVTGILSQGVAVTGDGTKVYYWILKAGTAGTSKLNWTDLDAFTVRNVTITWTNGVPTLAEDTPGLGVMAGDLFEVIALGDGWYLIASTIESVVAANDNQFALIADAVGSGSVYAWHAQLENASMFSSPIQSEASAAARVADSLYFPFNAVPQALTAYVRQINTGSWINTGVTRRYFRLGSQSVGVPPYLEMVGSSANLALGVTYANSPGSVSSFIGSGLASPLGTVVETAALFAADGAVTAIKAVDGGTPPVSGTPSAAHPVASAWALARLALAGFSSGETPSAITHVVVAAGTKTMEEMRALAEVA